MNRRHFIRNISLLATASAIAGSFPKDRFGEVEAVHLSDSEKPVATLGNGVRNAFGVTLGNGGTLRLPRGAKVYGCVIYANKIEGHDIDLQSCHIIVENKPSSAVINGCDGTTSGNVKNCFFDIRYPEYFKGACVSFPLV